MLGPFGGPAGGRTPLPGTATGDESGGRLALTLLAEEVGIGRVFVLAEQLPGNAILIGTAAQAIGLSILVHRLTANPLAARFGAREGNDPPA